MKPGRIVLVLTAAFAFLFLLAAPPADAHAYLSSSNPADGASLSRAPSQLQLGFSESIVLGSTSLNLVDSQGRSYPLTDLRVESSSADGDTEEPVTLSATLPSLPLSAYRLSWATLSRDDLHRTSGVIVFGIGQSVVAAGEREPRPSTAEVVLRWLLFAGIAGTFGGLLAARLAQRRGRDLIGAGRSNRIAALSALAAAVVAAVLLVEQSRTAGVTTVLEGRYGQGWLSREAGLLMLAGLAWSRRQSPLRLHRSAAAINTISIVAVAVGSALVGHSASAGLTYLVADALHLAAVATWVGAPAVLLAAVVGPARRLALIGFAAPAASCVAIIIGTGLYLVSDAVVSVDAAMATFYGRALLVKVGLFLIVSALGLLNYRLLRRSSGPARRTVLAESIAAVLVLGLAAVLTSSQPAREPEYGQSKVTASTAADLRAEDLQQTLSIKPNRPGQNVVVLGIFDTRRPAPGQISQVFVQLVEAGGATSEPILAQSLPDRTWSVPVTITTGGPIAVHVTVVRAGVAPVRSSFEWTVQRSTPHRATLLSQAPIRSPLQKLAITALCLAATAILIGWRRRSPAGASAPAPAAQSDQPQLVGAGHG